MHLDSIWNHPVKSMIGERVDSATITPSGMAGDRRWAVRDEVRGGIRGAKKIADLMRFEATSTGTDSALIRFPDGTTHTTDEVALDGLLSKALGQPVSLQVLRSADDLDHFRRGAPDSDDLLTELRAIFGRDEDEPLPDLSVFPPEIVEFETPPGTHHDAFPLLLLTTSALSSLATALPDSVVDLRRFRPSLVIDTGAETGHPEFDWVGRRLRIGEVELAITTACPRCVMVTRAISDQIPADRAVLRHIVRELDQNLGVYATVVVPGAIEEGDEVTLLD